MVRRLSLILFSGFFLSLNYAQFNRNTKSVSGSVNYIMHLEERNKGYSFLRVNPSIGYFIVDNLAISLSIDYIRRFYAKENSQKDSHRPGYGFGLKYYFHNLYAGYSFNIEKYTDLVLKRKIIETGYVIPLNEKVYIDLGLDYIDQRTGSQTRTLTFNIGIATFI